MISNSSIYYKTLAIRPNSAWMTSCLITISLKHHLVILMWTQSQSNIKVRATGMMIMRDGSLSRKKSWSSKIHIIQTLSVDTKFSSLKSCSSKRISSYISRSTSLISKKHQLTILEWSQKLKIKQFKTLKALIIAYRSSSKVNSSVKTILGTARIVRIMSEQPSN